MNTYTSYPQTPEIIHISLTQGQIATIDESDLELVSNYRWCAMKGGNSFYVVTNVRNPDGKRTTLKMHQLLMQTPKGLHTDHIDHDGLNNCRSNLRIVTNSQNQMNRRSHCGSSSSFKGVYWNKQCQKWQAHIQINKKLKYLGLFTSEQLAADAYNLAAKEAFGSFACLNGDT